MKINKQLFEDVLSGKLKGTFVLRGGSTLNSKCLKRTKNTSIYNSLYYPYALVGNGNNNIPYSFSYTENGIWNRLTVSSYDIIDFIQDKNMKENELTIKIPKGKIVDWDESKKQNKIVLKDKQLTYEDVCNKLQDMIDRINIPLSGTLYGKGNVLVANVHQLECILAKNQLANVAIYLNSLSDETTAKYYIYNGFNLNVQQLVEPKFNIGLVMFKSAELAQQAIEILGEETVKLALEPLGI